MSWFKRLLAVFSAAVLGTAVTSGSAEAQKRSLRDVKIPEKWSVGQGTDDGKPIITRFNMGLKPYLGDSEFPNQLGIAVPFKQHSADGLPTTAEIKELDAIEDEIVKRFTVGNESLFAGVVTTNNMREFILYTSNAKAATAKAEKLRKDITTHAIQFEMHDDPEWQNFKNLAPK
jgi:hypothetical protein